MNKKGLTESIISIFLLIGFLILILIGVFVWGLLAPPVGSSIDKIGSTITNINGDNPQVQSALNTTVVPLVEASHSVQWISYGLIIVSFFVFFVLCFSVRGHPALIFVWIGLMIVVVFISIIFASSYQGVAGSDPSYSQWTANDYFLRYLPFIFAGMGLVGGIFLFVLITKDPESGVNL